MKLLVTAFNLLRTTTQNLLPLQCLLTKLMNMIETIACLTKVETIEIYKGKDKDNTTNEKIQF